MSELAVGLTIGATVRASVGAATGATMKHIDRLGQTVDALNARVLQIQQRRGLERSIPAGAGEPGTVSAVGFGLAPLLIRIDRRIDRAVDRFEEAMATFRAEMHRLAERRLEGSFVRAATKRAAIGLRVNGW